MLKKQFFCRYLITVLSLLYCLTSAFGAEKKVVLVSQDKESFDKLNKDEKNFASSAFQQFLAGISRNAQINIRTEDLTADLRKIQKESQKEVESGTATEAHKIDRRTLAHYSIKFSFSKKSGNYLMTADVSDIETNESFVINSSGNTAAETAKDETVDKFAYDVLTGMSSRGYIDSLAQDVVTQLLHSENSADTYRKYIDDYTKQLAEADRELQSLKDSKKDSADKLALQDAERALKLKKDMIERNRQIAEENLRKKQAEDEAKKKREAELAKMQAASQKDFLAKIRQIDEKRSQIQAAERSRLSLKKRIELIEQGRNNLAALNEALDASVSEAVRKLSEEESKEVEAKQAEPYRKAETLSDGVTPTEAAKKHREGDVDKIHKKYYKLKADTSNEIRNSARPSIKQYEEQVYTNLDELQKTTYVFRSIDSSEDYLRLSVDEFDGSNYSWAIHNTFNIQDVPLLYLEYSKLPAYQVSYTMMTGKKVPKEGDKDYDEAYEEYLDLVESADLYFRTSVPYLYSQIAIRVNYDSLKGRYVAMPVSFEIYKTEDNKKPLLTRNEKDFNKDREDETRRLRELEREEEAKRRAAERAAQKEAAQLEKEAEEEERRIQREQEEERKREESEAFWSEVHASQHARNGLIYEAGFINDTTYSGFDSSIQLLIGGRHWFFGGGLDLMGLELKDDYHFDVSSSYANRTGFGGITGFALMGFTVTMGKFAPYVATGFGGHSFFVWTGNENTSTSSSSSSTSAQQREPSTACLQGGIYWLNEAGFDIRLNHGCAVGASYKLKYFSGVGFADAFNIGFALGLY